MSGLAAGFTIAIADAIVDAVAAAGIGLVVTDDGDPSRTVYASEAAARILRGAHEELIGVPQPCSIEQDGRRLTVNFVSDLTERRAAELALSRTETQFRRLIETVPEAIW